MLGQGLKLTAIGIAGGVAGALVLGRFLESVVFEVSPTEPLILVAAAVGLTAVSLLASWLPARWAARVDPMLALRSE